MPIASLRYIVATATIFAATAALAQSGSQFDDGPAPSTTSEPSAAPSGDLIIGNSFDQIIAVLQKNGLPGELTTDSQGDPMIRSQSSDFSFIIYFYGCTDNKDCTMLQFVKGWDLPNGATLAKIDEWNSTKLWGKAYRNDEKDPWIAVLVNVEFGISADNLSSTVDWWKYVVPEFKEFMGIE